MKKMNDKGFSLVELMVVIGIMAIVASIFTLGFSLVSNKQVDQCAKKIQMSLENARSTSMGKSNVGLHFYYSGGKIYVEKTLNYSAAQTTVSEVGDGALAVTYKLSGEADETDLKTTQIYDISFDRASGSLKPQGGTVYLEYFKVSNGRKTLTIKIEQLTGRVTIE